VSREIKCEKLRG